MNARYVLLLTILLAFLATPPHRAAANFVEIDAFVRAEMERAGIPGLALAVVQGDEVVYLQGYGRANDNGTAVTPQTPFIIGSIGKTFTALAIQQLAGSGQIDLNAPVQRYLPDFTLADPQAAAQITVQQLLDHTSGIPKAAGEEAYQLDPQYSTAELVKKAANVMPNRPAGVSREYSNVNYLLLGLVVEAVSGQSYTDYVQEHIWQPLAMTHSYFSEEAAQAAGMATGYRTLYGLRFPTHAPFPPGMIPSGYAISSAEDLSHYLAAYLNAGHYEGASVLDRTGYYDIYWNRLPGSVTSVETSQSGGTLNFNADIHLLLGRGVGVATLTNTRHLWDDALPVTTAASIARGVAYRVARMPAPAVPAMSLWQSYLLLDLLALGLVVWALYRIGRLIRSRGTVVSGNWGSALSISLDLGLGAVLLAGVPTLSGQRWDYLLSTQPDLAGLVLAAGIILAAAGAVRVGQFVSQRRQEALATSV